MNVVSREHVFSCVKSSSAILDRLKDEINAENRIISTITTHDYYSEEGRRKAKHIKILSKKAEEYDLILESQRVEAVVRKHDELYPPVTEDCPICLETVRSEYLASLTYFTCCGKCICRSCSEDIGDRVKDGNGLKCCPLCRAHIPNTKAQHKRMQKHAKAGRVWAQIIIGIQYSTGWSGHPVDKREALRLLKPIVEAPKNSCLMYSDALLEMSILYREGIEGVLQPCPTMEMKYLEDAANRGHIIARYQLAKKYDAMEGDENKAKATLYFTLGSSQGHIYSWNELADRYRFGLAGLNVSQYRAKHYNLKAAERGSYNAYLKLAFVLMELCCLQYGGWSRMKAGPDFPRAGSSAHFDFETKAMSITGHSCIPRALFWLRKSVLANAESRSSSANLIRQLEERGKQACANCRKKAACFPQPLKTCVRCKAVWYCGKEVQAWSAGHKIDCVKQE